MECKRYKIDDTELFKISFAKYTDDAIVEAKEQMLECLQCEYFKNCEDKYPFIRELDKNIL